METPSDLTWEDVIAFCKMGDIRWREDFNCDAYVIVRPKDGVQYWCHKEMPEAAMMFLSGEDSWKIPPRT